MDELPKSMRNEENFFDDGDDKILGRIDEGENFAEAYDLQKADPSQMSARQDTSQTKINADDFDFRMEGRANPKAPKGLKQKSVHTGPKGVQKDYNDSKEAVRIQKTFDAMRSERAINQASSSKHAFYVDDIVQEMAQLEPTIQTDEERERAIIKARMKARSNNNQANESENDDEDSDDERLFAKFREERVKNIQASLPSYGSYMKADTLEELAELLKNNHEACYVVAHIYQNKNPTCISVHLTFEAIAPQFPHVAFIRIKSDVAFNSSYDISALPTLLLYKGSKLHKSIISLATILGKNPSDRELVQFLADQGVLRIPAMGLDNITLKDKRIWKDDYEEGNSDEEEHEKYRKSHGPIKTSTILSSDPYASGFDSSLLNYSRMSNVFQDEGLDSDNDAKDVKDENEEFFYDM